MTTLSKPAESSRTFAIFAALRQRIHNALSRLRVERNCEPLLIEAAHAKPEARDELIARYARVRGISKADALARMREIAPESREDLTRMIGP